jgi:hypothetical protein
MGDLAPVGGMKFVDTDEDIAASREISLVVIGHVAAANTPGIAIHALMMVLTYYLACSVDQGWILESETDAVLDDFHGAAKQKLASERIKAVH